MTDEIDVRRPREMLWVLSAANQELSVRLHLRRLQQQCFERFLTILGVSPQIGKIGFIMRERPRGTMQIRVDMTIERRDTSGAQSSAKFIQRAAPAVAQYQIK